MNDINDKKMRDKWYREMTLLNRDMVLYRLLCVVVGALLLGILLYIVASLPNIGDADAPTNNVVSERYIESGVEETGAINLVAGMILDYRAFDTFGESNVLFLGVCAVVLLLLNDKNNEDMRINREMLEDEHFDLMHQNVILRKVALVVVPVAIIFGFYVIFNGHLSLGGGFSGGAIIGGGLVLYSIAYGFDRMHKLLNYRRYMWIVCCCLMVYCLSKSYSFFTGANHLHSIISTGVPGTIFSAGLILPLNICVGLIVALTVYGFYALFTRGEI